jgi:protein TonB
MTSTYPLYPCIRTANDRFKAQYRKYLRWSAAFALGLTILVFLFSPRYVPRPYTLPHNQIQLVNVEVWEVPPPPREAPKPPLPLEPAPNSQVQTDPQIDPTLMSWQHLPPMPIPRPEVPSDLDFVPSSSKPKLLFFAAPEYPEIARMSRMEGEVIVKVLVGVDGSVILSEIQLGAGPILNRAALAAARRCRFQPGLQRGNPVAVWMAIPYRFRLH